MKYLVICMLIIAGVVSAGCTGPQAPPPSTTLQTTVAVTATVVVNETARPTFALGDYYLEDPGGYRFLTENDTVVKVFRVDNPSWGIYFKVQPLSENLSSCWFVVDVSKADFPNSTESYSFGNGLSSDLEKWIPMYGEGSYKLTMNGNNVKVWLTAAKRLP